MLIADPIATSVVTLISLVLVTACAVTDVLSRRIPNLFLATAFSLALICYGLDKGISGLIDSCLGLLVGLAMLTPIYILGGTGAGDVKLLGVVGSLLGTQGVFIAGVATFISGGLLGIIWILWRIIDAFFAEQFLRYSQLKSVGLSPISGLIPHVKIHGSSFPYAPAIACGTYTTIWYLGLLSPAAR
jgi:prepilin peptidase CpaA